MQNIDLAIDIKTLTLEEAKEICVSLSNDIDRYNKAYYSEDHPLVTDAEYDTLVAFYQKLLSNFPQFADKALLTQVGAEPSEKFKKIKHQVPMLSLANGFAEDDLTNFVEKIQKFLMVSHFIPLCCELKIDGLSFSARYEKGQLVYVATRGNGEKGEDVTANMRTIANFPSSLPATPAAFEVRGEVYISKQDFLALNQQQEAKGLQKFANPRNAAAGSLRQLNANITRQRPLKYFVYALGEVSQPIADTQCDLLTYLRKLGFQIEPHYRLALSLAEAMDFYQQIFKARAQLDFEIDGVVYKVNELNLQERLGVVGRTPRASLAYKFPAVIGETKLLEIKVQVGRTGVLTPVAQLEPVNIGGVVVSRASLHNFKEIERKGLRLGDYVQLIRAGDVIPQINGVNLSRRTKECQPILRPELCPECASPLEYENVAIRCSNNFGCSAQILEHLKHFVSKDALNIDGLGAAQLALLLKHDFIKTPVDLLLLSEAGLETQERLASLEGLGKKSSQKLLESIAKSRTISLARLVSALGIRHIGNNNAKILAEITKTFATFLKLATEFAQGQCPKELVGVSGLGEATLHSLQGFFAIPQNVELCQQLAKILVIEGPVNHHQSQYQSKISNKTIVFTGKLTLFSRAEAKDQAEKLGAIVASAVSNNTDLLVCGAESGAKLKKAEQFGIEVIDEEQWLQLITT